MKNIHIIPTDKPSRLVKLSMFGKDKLVLCKEILPIQDEETYQNIHITSEAKIKNVRPYKGKWHLEKENMLNKFPNYLTDLSECKLIILTTDQDLINEGVQPISDEFLEWFVKNPNCEKVKTNIEFLQSADNLKDGFYYQIIIPKQETIKEARERCFNEMVADTSRDRGNEGVKEFIILGVNFGVKWQKERSYSEEEVLDLLLKSEEYTSRFNNRTDLTTWFEQFKKK